MWIKLTKWDIKRIRHALILAIDYEQSSIDAYRTKLRITKGC